MLSSGKPNSGPPADSTNAWAVCTTTTWLADDGIDSADPQAPAGSLAPTGNRAAA